MKSKPTNVIGLGLMIVSLAMLSVVIVNGGKTGGIITASGRLFTNSIKAATYKGGKGNPYPAY